MATNETFVRKHAVVIYFALTLLISWGGLLAIMGPAAMLGVAEVPVERMALLYVAMLLGPAVAGLLMIGLVHGRPGYAELFARLRRWRVGAVWYGIAIVTAPGLVALALLALSLFSPAYLPGIVTAPDKGTLLLSGIIVGILVGVCEELGWTGFAIPQLRLRHGLLATALMVGLVWGLWHAPLFTASARASLKVPPVLTLLVSLFTFLPAFRVLLVWVYDRTQSLLLAMLMHASQTATTLVFALSASDLESVVSNLAYTALLWLLIALVVLPKRGLPQPRAASRPQQV